MRIVAAVKMALPLPMFCTLVLAATIQFALGFRHVVHTEVKPQALTVDRNASSYNSTLSLTHDALTGGGADELDGSNGSMPAGHISSSLLEMSSKDTIVSALDTAVHQDAHETQQYSTSLSPRHEYHGAAKAKQTTGSLGFDIEIPMKYSDSKDLRIKWKTGRSKELNVKWNTDQNLRQAIRAAFPSGNFPEGEVDIDKKEFPVTFVTDNGECEWSSQSSIEVLRQIAKALGKRDCCEEEEEDGWGINSVDFGELHLRPKSEQATEYCGQA